MSAHRDLVDFIDGRLSALLRRPAVWGSDASVEDQVILLIEIRHLAIGRVEDSASLQGRYVRFVAQAVSDATPEPLAVQLARRDRGADLPVILRRFVDREVGALPDGPLGGARPVPIAAIRRRWPLLGHRVIDFAELRKK